MCQCTYSGMVSLWLDHAIMVLLHPEVELRLIQPTYVASQAPSRASTGICLDSATAQLEDAKSMGQVGRAVFTHKALQRPSTTSALHT
jgi:hypothetical protein